MHGQRRTRFTSGKVWLVRNNQGKTEKVRRSQMKKLIFILVTLIAPLVASADCSFQAGASTPQAVFDQSCRQQGGVPHGCSCDAPGSGSSSSSSSSGGNNLREQMMLQGAAILGNALGQALRGNPEEDARRKAAADLAAEQRRQAEEQQRQADEQRRTDNLRQQEIAKQRILGMLKGTEQSSGLSLKTGDDDTPMTGGTTQFFGTKQNGCSSSQDASVVDLCGLQLKLGDDAGTIKIDPSAASIGGVGLTSGQADSRPSLNAGMNTKVLSSPANQGLQLKLGDDAPILPLDKPIALIPRQGDPGHLAPGGPIASRPAICDGLSQQLDEAYQLARLSLLASDVYERYGSIKAPSPGITAVDRISDKINKDEIAEMHKLFPGMRSEAVNDLLQPKDSDYRAAIYENYVMGSDGTHHYTKKLVLVFRGTSTLGDWANANGPQAAGLGSDYYTKAIYLAHKLKVFADANRDQLELVGHSMGGGMADAAGLANKIKTTTFNPSGVHPNSVRGADMSSAQLYLTDYVVDGEPLNWHQDP